MSELPSNAGPLYEKVKEYVLANIGNGQWQTDHRLPSENELVAMLGVSRMTVNRALRELTAAGILVRIQGVGTFVAPPRPQSALIEINNIAAEIAARGHVHRADVVILETIAAPPELLVAFEMETRRDIYHSIVVHFEDDTPVQLEERFVNPDLFAEYDRQDFTRISTYEYLSQKTPVSEVEHIISAIPADAEIASLLGVEAGACCLLLRRRTWTSGVVATVNRLTYVGSRYALGSRYSPARGK